VSKKNRVCSVSHCIVNTSDCISSIQNLIQFFVIVKLSLFQLWLSIGSLLELSLSKGSLFQLWLSIEVSWSCPWAEKSLSCVIEQLVIWHYILVELSLEVQGGQDYFRFVEGTCIIACVLYFSVLLLSYPLHKTLNSLRLWTSSDSKPENIFWTKEKRSFWNTQFNPPPSCGFFTFINI